MEIVVHFYELYFTRQIIRPIYLIFFFLRIGVTDQLLWIIKYINNMTYINKTYLYKL